MRILVFNCGSSTLKCALFEFFSFPEEKTPPVWQKHLEWSSSCRKEVEEILDSLHGHLDCIGHRIVHGGPHYNQTCLIDEALKKEVKRWASAAPLHNGEDLEVIQLLEKKFSHVPQYAVFDTAFHHTLSPAAFVYPGPYEWVEKGIRRFGFHGISFQYCTQRAETLLKKDPGNLVICHLGSGASLCAVQNKKSIDTTMGFTPLEGLMMETRSGSVDPGILLYLLSHEGKSLAELSHLLYQKSGLLGLSGVSGDLRDLWGKTVMRSELALEVYFHRLISSIGSMVASLGGLDTLVFTGGIGENAEKVREKVCEKLEFLEVKLQKSKIPADQDREISPAYSKVKVLVIHTQEEFEIARECFKKRLNASFG